MAQLEYRPRINPQVQQLQLGHSLNAFVIRLLKRSDHVRWIFASMFVSSLIYVKSSFKDLIIKSIILLLDSNCFLIPPKGELSTGVYRCIRSSVWETLSSFIKLSRRFEQCCIFRPPEVLCEGASIQTKSDHAEEAQVGNHLPKGLHKELRKVSCLIFNPSQILQE